MFYLQKTTSLSILSPISEKKLRAQTNQASYCPISLRHKFPALAADWFLCATEKWEVSSGNKFCEKREKESENIREHPDANVCAPRRRSICQSINFALVLLGGAWAAFTKSVPLIQSTRFSFSHFLAYGSINKHTVVTVKGGEIKEFAHGQIFLIEENKIRN